MALQALPHAGVPGPTGQYDSAHPELRVSTPDTEWDFAGSMRRMPEFTAPALGNRPNIVTIDADVPANASGVLYKLGGAGGGLTCYVDKGTVPSWPSPEEPLSPQM